MCYVFLPSTQDMLVAYRSPVAYDPGHCQNIVSRDGIQAYRRIEQRLYILTDTSQKLLHEILPLVLHRQSLYRSLDWLGFKILFPRSRSFEKVLFARSQVRRVRMTGCDPLVEICREQLVEHWRDHTITVEQSRDVTLRLQFEKDAALPLEQPLACRDKDLQEEFIQVPEAHIMTLYKTGYEGRSVRLAYCFLVRGREQLNSDCINERIVPTVHLPRLIEQILPRNVCLAFFVVFRREALDFRERGLRETQYDLARLHVC